MFCAGQHAVPVSGEPVQHELMQLEKARSNVWISFGLHAQAGVFNERGNIVKMRENHGVLQAMSEADAIFEFPQPL